MTSGAAEEIGIIARLRKTLGIEIIASPRPGIRVELEQAAMQRIGSTSSDGIENRSARATVGRIVITGDYIHLLNRV